MKIAPKPANEAERLKKLRLYDILDTPAEEPFDRITRMVAAVLDVPIALVTLVDEDRQWFKSKRGLGPRETPRDVAFCSHAILGDDVFVVEDATRDAHFADNPLVELPPSIRFYAGAPLETPDGYNLGTLCAIDRKPRRIDAEQRQFLQDLAHLVVDEMELRIATANALSNLATIRELQAHRDHYLSRVGHEIRTPLTSIRAALGLVEGGAAGTLPEKVRHLVSMANRNTGRLVDLTNDMLDVEKLSAGRTDMRFAVTDAGAVLSEAREAMAGLAEECGVTLEAQIQPTDTILADGSKLRQALTNLISNAIKFSPEHGRVSARVSQTRNAIVFEVDDQGPGIPQDFQSVMFNRFTRAEGALGKPGSGLGLSIVKAIADGHNGRVECTSRVGEGSVFRLVIPRRQSVVPLRGASQARSTDAMH